MSGHGMTKTIPFCFWEEVMQKIWQSDSILEFIRKELLPRKRDLEVFSPLLQQNTEQSWLFQTVSINKWLVLDRHSWRVLCRCFIDTCHIKKKINFFRALWKEPDFFQNQLVIILHFRTTKKTHKWTISKALENAAREKESRKRED